jgi:hypothetical protein
MFTVAIFMCDKAYGGHEEGGWWYTYGTPDEEHAHCTRHFENEEDAQKYASLLDELITHSLNVDRPSIDSVLSSGQYWAVIQEGNTPQPFPSERPYYS